MAAAMPHAILGTQTYMNKCAGDSDLRGKVEKEEIPQEQR
jgi:hypothetical protein